MRFASSGIAALNLDWYLIRRTRKGRNNTHYGGLAVLCSVEISASLGQGRFPLGVVARAKPVALLRNDIMAISPPTLCDHECSRLSVVGFIVGKVVPSGTCRHAVSAEVGRRQRLGLILYCGGGGGETHGVQWFIKVYLKRARGSRAHTRSSMSD